MDEQKVISDTDTSDSEPETNTLEKPKRQYNRKPMTDEKKEELKQRLAKARDTKKLKNEIKKEVVKKQEIVKKEKIEKKAKEPKTIVNNYYYKEPEPKAEPKQEPKQETKAPKVKSAPKPKEIMFL